MKKTNKNGWGLKSELIYILIFVLCLIIAIIWMSRAGLASRESALDPTNNSSVNTNNAVYYDFVDKMTLASKRYVSNVLEGAVVDEVTISDEMLINKNYLKMSNEEKSDNCTGYVKVVNDIILKYNVYIKCDSFKTPGYEY